MFPILYIFNNWAVLFLRLILGTTLVLHGWPKVKDLKKTAENFHGMGFRPGNFWGTLAAITEFGGGWAIVLGLFTQIVAIIVIGEFIIIMGWQLKNGAKWVHGYELDLFVLAATFMLLTTGIGPWALDKFFFGI